jgi:hypothetical protein
MKINYLLKSFSIVVLFSFCSSKKEESKKIPYEIESVYFQKWIGGQELTGSGTNFHLKLKNKLPQNTQLVKVYFQNKEANFDKEDETTFLARFYSKPQNPDLILDEDSTKEYGNKAPEITKPRFDLKDTEAMLEFQNDTKIEHYKLVDIKEKELIAYPSARPRN